MCILQCLGYCPKSYVRVLTQSDTLTIAREKAAKALKEKGETPEELLRSIKENEAAVAEAQRTVDAWNAFVGEKSRREEAAKAEAERIATKKAEEAVEKDAELKEDKKKPQIKDVVKTIYEKGKAVASKLFGRSFFDVAKTPDFMKKLGLTGDRFTIKYGVLSRHAGKDASHLLTEKQWEELPDAIQKPFAITRFGEKENGYRLYTTMKNDKGETIVVGVDVKNIGRNLEVNSISTIFGRRGDAKITQKEEVLYTDEKITPEQRSLLGQPNSDQYTDTRERNVSADKGSEKPEKKQEKQSVFDKAKEIADKEEKKRKAEADSVLGQATRAVGKKKKVNLFKYTASKIISYPALRGVHYANGYAYASDGYILFKEKADYPKEWEGTTRDKDGNLIDGKYPDTEKAIHRLVHIPDKEAVSLPSKEVLDFAIAASKKLKGEAIPVAIDGLFFNAVNLKKFLEAVASKGMDKIVYRHPMLYATNGKDEIVMMPTVNTLEGALDIADRMERAGLPKEQIDAWKAHIEAADKKKSFDDFKKAVENAKKKSVSPTEAEKPKEQPLTEAERKDAEEVAGALGYRVEWVDTMEENGTIDADKKVIRIAKDAENPLVQVLGHEVTHGVRRMIGGKFRALQKAAMEVVGEKEWNER
uniref:MuF-C-terminal domain-containing protein n=1 Tax=Candidatus Limisoma sp. TaxID=3076476 RepID=UPI004028E5DF